MKAAVLTAFGAPLEIRNVPDPLLGTGEVIVDIAAAGVTSYAARVFDGTRNYPLELPVIPGAGGIGRVRETGPDATRLEVGDWVYCEPTVRSRDDALTPDTILQGWTHRSPAGLALHRFHHDGSFAERLRLPTENVTPIGAIDPAHASRWTAVGRLLVPYGGLLAGELQAGETVVVNGATGGFGGAGVAVALAMGAARVIAAGRNPQTLKDLAARFGPRVSSARMSGDEGADREAIMNAAEGPIDLVLDFLPREAAAAQVMTALTTLRHGGRAVLMGGLRGDSGRLPIAHDWLMHQGITLRGQWMYPREAIGRLIRMIRAGLIDLQGFELTEFPLDQANDAVAHAAAHPAPRQLTVIRPDW